LKPRIAAVAFIAILAILGVFALPAAAVIPVVTIEDATNVTYTTAEVKGEVNPEGQSTTWRLQYSTQADFSSDVNTVEEEGTESAKSVEREVNGLSPGTIYYLRLQAENTDGQVEDVTIPFETKAVARPMIENLEVSSVTVNSAHFSAKIDPNGSDHAFDTSWRFECTPSCGSLSGDPVEGSAATVEANATSLDPNTNYAVRLYASNSGGEAKATETFQTGGAGSRVEAFAAGPVQPTAVGINGEVNPRGSSTIYWFEWGTEDCSIPGAGCQSIPAEQDASAGNGNLFKYVFRQLTGLAPGTTYHFRLVAENAFGTIESPDQEFATAALEPGCTNESMPGTGLLPDCRAYEMVSPSEKNGADVIVHASKTIAAPNGDGVTFAATGAFGEAQGTATDVQYLSRRDGAAETNGWRTHAITPLNGAETFLALANANAPSYEYFTPNLTSGIFQAWRPLTEEPNVSGITNLYRVDDLDGSTLQPKLLSGSMSPLIPPPQKTAKLLYQNRFDAASEDLSHVLFQSPWNLTGDGSFSFTGDLYEYADGVGVRRVGRIPAGSASECDDEAGPPCVDASSAQAGISASLVIGGSQYSTNMISNDGSRILFQVHAGEPEGALYMREDGVRTIQINASEKSVPESPGTAQAWDMSRDGSRVFFTTSEGLVAGDDDGGSDLYMFDVTAPAGSRLTRLSFDPATGRTCYAHGLVGASMDGHYVYFLCTGNLLPGQPASSVGLYSWHDGKRAFVGSFEDVNLAQLNTPRVTWQFFKELRMSKVTPDGRHLLFMSTVDNGFQGRGGYSGFDHGSCNGGTPCRELYLYSADTGRLACVSCDPSGTPPTDDASTDIFRPSGVGTPTSHLSHALSDDGRRVFFSTANALVPGDTNGVSDAYEYDSSTSQLHLISAGTSESPSYFMEASPDGSDAFFVTRDRLVGWDNDTSYDLYDARIGGGFPEPVVASAPCEGDGCLPPAAARPDPPFVGSLAIRMGNPPPRCRNSKRHRRGRKGVHCAKHHKHHKRATVTDGRAGR
jgi:hypothetical protein